MKQDRRFFSLPLFWEGVKQTKLFGILFSVILGLQILLVFGLPALTFLTDEKFRLESYIPQVMDGYDAAPLLLALFCVVSPILTISLLRFLNQRASADFYHALPYTRVCVYFSLIASVFFWIILYALEALFLSLLMGFFCSAFFTLLTSKLCIYVLSLTIAALAVSAGISIAMSVTGTIFSNLVLSAMILFLPRLILLCLTLAVTEALPILSAGQLSPLLDGGINLITGTVFGALLGFLFGEQFLPSPRAVLASPAAIGYTALLLIVYLALGCLCFVRRKSETAQRSAPSPRLQALYRILLVFSYFAVFTCLLYSQILQNTVRWQVYFLVILFGLLLYYLYELFTTRSLKKTFAATPGLGIVALSVLLFFGLLRGMTQMELYFTPTAEEIESVTLLAETQDNDYPDFKGYVEFCSPEVKLGNRELIGLIAGRLSEQTVLLREDGHQSFRDTYQRAYFYDDSYSYSGSGSQSLSYSVSYTPISFRISSRAGEKVRTVFLTHDEIVTLTEAMERDEAYRAMWMTLPEAIGPITLSGSFLPWEESKNEAFKEVYALAREELKVADFDSWYQFCSNASGDFFLSYVIAEGRAEGKTLNLTLSPEVFPKAVARCYELEVELLQKKAQDIESLLRIYDEAEEDEQLGWHLEVSVSLPKKDYAWQSLSAEGEDAVRYVLNHLLTTPRTPSKDEGYANAYVYIESPQKGIVTEDTAYGALYEMVGTSTNFLLDESFSVEEFYPLSYQVQED